MTLNESQFYEQLPMFATARELREGNATEGDWWEDKHDEAWDTGLYHSVAMEGVHKPVNIRPSPGRHERWLINGHHRVAAQYDADPDALVPLNWTQRTFDNESWGPRDR